VPTCCLTANEKTVTTAHSANIVVRNPDIVPIGRFLAKVNGRVHCETRRIPLEMLDEERIRLHQAPEHLHTQAFGTTRQVHDKDSTIRVEQARYSAPHQHVERQVFVRWHGDALMITGIRLRR
jgi:hypothetical protein